jgi:hypothetical protein
MLLMSEGESKHDNPPVPAQPSEMYVIVVAGMQDPRQHHPLWYKLIGVLSEDESRVAVSSTVATPELTMFDAGVFSVMCDRNRWQIATQDQTLCERIKNVTSTVFDDKLFQIYVYAIGINCLLNPESGSVKQFGAVLARVVNSKGFIPPIEGEQNCRLTFVSDAQQRRTHVEIGESPIAPSRLFVSHNVHREVPKQDGYYTLSGQLQHCESDWRHGRQFASETVRRLEALAEESHAD